MSEREILFRGKDLQEQNGWLYGYFYKSDINKRERESGKATLVFTPNCDTFIYAPEYHNSWMVKPETVGQYTGLTDKNGTRIFEGDILGYSEHSEYFRYLNNVRFAVFYDNENARFSVERYVNGNYECTKRLAAFNPSEHLKVIGNIHDAERRVIAMDNCSRNTLCVDCDNTNCVFQGEKKSDCPKWRCDRPDYAKLNCDHCGFIDKFIKDMREMYNSELLKGE